MGRDRNERETSDKVTVEKPWLPISLRLLQSTAFASLSPHAAKLFLDLASQLYGNAMRNGELCASYAVMRERGWTSAASLNAALGELVSRDLVLITRAGRQRVPALCALTPWPMAITKRELVQTLDHQAGSYTTDDWKKHGEARPTRQSPARWARLRAGEPWRAFVDPGSGSNEAAHEPGPGQQRHCAADTNPTRDRVAAVSCAKRSRVGTAS